MSTGLSTDRNGDAAPRNALMRKRDVRRFRALVNEFRDQIARDLTASEEVLLSNAATLSLMCQRNQHAILMGEPTADPDGYRRNLQALRAVMQSIGLAKKSRDVTRKDFANGPSVLSQLIDGE